MVEYSCSECNYTSSQKGHVKRHVNKNNKCGENPQIVVVETRVHCQYCDKELKSIYTLTRHKKICKSKELLDAHKEIEELKLKLANKSTVNNTVNNNNVTINIQVNGYKDTDFSRISDKMFSGALGKTLMSIPKMIENVHFNPKLPENHNIYYQTKRVNMLWYIMEKNGK